MTMGLPDGESDVAAAGMAQLGPVMDMARDSLAIGEQDLVARQTTLREMLAREAIVSRFIGVLPAAEYSYDKGGDISKSRMHATTEVGVRATQASVLWTYGYGARPYYVVGECPIPEGTKIGKERLKRPTTELLLFPAHDASNSRILLPATMLLFQEDNELRHALGDRGFAEPSGLPVDRNGIEISAWTPNSARITPYARRPKLGRATIETIAEKGVRAAVEWPHVTRYKEGFLTQQLWEAYGITRTLDELAVKFGKQKELLALMNGDADEKDATPSASAALGAAARRGLSNLKRLLST